MPGKRRTPRGCRAGHVHKLNIVSAAYKLPVAQAAKAYDGSNGVTAHVMAARLTVTAPCYVPTTDHENAVQDVLEPLPSMSHPLIEVIK